MSLKQIENLIDCQDKIRQGKWEWRLKWTFISHTCAVSGHRIPAFTLAYKGYKKRLFPIGANGNEILETKWVDKHVFLILQLKNDFTENGAIKE